MESHLGSPDIFGSLLGFLMYLLFFSGKQSEMRSFFFKNNQNQSGAFFRHPVRGRAIGKYQKDSFSRP